MITAREIKNKADRKYYEVLQSSLKGENCFPLVIRSNKTLSKDFVQMSREIAEVFSASKDRNGFGYLVDSESVKTRQHGTQNIPRSIIFEGLSDYLKFIGKEKEYRLAIENFYLIRSELPQLELWLGENPKVVIDNLDIWPDLLEVCKWFLNNFEPDRYYIRELPIPIHTKFVEENKPVLRLLLDVLVPDTILPSENLFEKRYSLKYDQPLVRLRSLDPACWHNRHYDDLTVQIEQFKKNPISCETVFIVENKMNFLTFPQTPFSIVIWGKGFALESLKNTEWLQNRKICYWSDLDVQGFQMLSQLRSYFPQVQSFLMGREIVESYGKFIVNGTPSITKHPAHLSAEEFDVYMYLFQNNLRLEQERIPQDEVVGYIKALL